MQQMKEKQIITNQRKKKVFKQKTNNLKQSKQIPTHSDIHATPNSHPFIIHALGVSTLKPPLNCFAKGNTYTIPPSHIVDQALPISIDSIGTQVPYNSQSPCNEADTFTDHPMKVHLESPTILSIPTTPFTHKKKLDFHTS